MAWLKNRGKKKEPKQIDSETGKEPEQERWSMYRPTEPDFLTRGVSDVAKIPTIPFIGFRFCYDLFQYSDLLRTIVRALTNETFRSDIVITKAFVLKCNICGAEYNTAVDRCAVCGSDSLREPDKSQYEYLKTWMKDVNFNDQTLKEVCMELDADLNIIDNCFICVTKKYYFKDGKVIAATPIELLRAPPEKVNMIIDKNGRFGRIDDGRVVCFCLEHRERYVLNRIEEIDDAVCETCGKHLYPAYYRVAKGGQKFIYYTNGEILHTKKFNFGIGYGLPPIFSIWQKVMILMKMDFFVMTAYNLERPPKGLLLMKGNRESIDKSWRRMQEEARVNPHMIYPLIMEGNKDVKNVVEWLDMTIKSDDIHFIEYRDELRRTIGAMFGVMPIFTGDAAQGFGLSNEGLQILVTNRAVEDEQNIFDEKLFPWIARQLGVHDWKFELIPSEGRNIVSKLQREQMRIQNAQMMQGLGYEIRAVIGEDGVEFEYYEMSEDGTIAAIPSATRAVARKMSIRRMQRFDGEPEHGKPSQEGQRYEGETSNIRRPKYEEGEGERPQETKPPIQNKSLTKDVTKADIGIDLTKKDVEWFTHVMDDDDLEVLKEGWSKAVRTRFEGIASGRFDAMNDVGFWSQYKGMSKRRSQRINGILYKAILEKNTNMDAIVDEMVITTGIDRGQAEKIVKTEFAHIALEARKVVLEKRHVDKAAFVAHESSCEICKRIAERTKDGVSLQKLDQIIAEEGGRDLLPHPQCNCGIKGTK